MGFLDLLTGKQRPYRAALLQPTEQKMYFDLAPVIMMPPLIHGPGAPPWGTQESAEDNSAVFACLTAISDSFTEATLKVWREDQPGDREELPDHPLMSLLDKPHPRLSMADLWWWVQWAKNIEGNAYLHKRRTSERTGNVVELWPISPTRMTPVTDGPNDFISAYAWERTPGKKERIPVEDIVHFRFGVDDRDPRLGCAPLKRLLREVATDREATAFSDALLSNFAIPGLVAETPAESNMSREDAEDLKAHLQQAYGAGNRGNVGVLRGGAVLKTLGFSPEQMNLKVLHQIPETRICAVFRVPPAVAGLSVGLEQTSNYASFREVREMFTERTLIPLWRSEAEVVNRQLLPDFEADRSVEAAFDLSDVRALQEDQDKLYARLNEAVKTGWVLPDEARSEVSLPPMPVAAPAEEDEDEEPEEEPDEEEDEAENRRQAAALARHLLERKARGEDLPALFEVMVELAAPAFEADIERFLQGQRRRVRRAITGG